MESITRFPDDTPTFVSPRQWGCERKVWYQNRKDARRNRTQGTKVYRCVWCRGYHIGTHRTFTERQARRAGPEA